MARCRRSSSLPTIFGSQKLRQRTFHVNESLSLASHSRIPPVQQRPLRESARTIADTCNRCRRESSLDVGRHVDTLIRADTGNATCRYSTGKTWQAVHARLDGAGLRVTADARGKGAAVRQSPDGGSATGPHCATPGSAAVWHSRGLRCRGLHRMAGVSHFSHVSHVHTACGGRSRSVRCATIASGSEGFRTGMTDPGVASGVP